MGSGHGGPLNPTPEVVLWLFVFVCSVTGAVALSYVVDSNERGWIPSLRSLPP
jgi:hypothetical protein